MPGWGCSSVGMCPGVWEEGKCGNHTHVTSPRERHSSESLNTSPPTWFPAAQHKLWDSSSGAHHSTPEVHEVRGGDVACLFRWGARHTWSHSFPPFPTLLPLPSSPTRLSPPPSHPCCPLHHGRGVGAASPVLKQNKEMTAAVDGTDVRTLSPHTCNVG